MAEHVSMHSALEHELHEDVPASGQSRGTTQQAPPPSGSQSPAGKRRAQRASVGHATAAEHGTALVSHAPDVDALAPWLLRMQSFQYVSPSQPHTGAGTVLQ
jgi:hypothetical protein